MCKWLDLRSLRRILACGMLISSSEPAALGTVPTAFVVFAAVTSVPRDAANALPRDNPVVLDHIM